MVYFTKSVPNEQQWYSENAHWLICLSSRARPGRTCPWNISSCRSLFVWLSIACCSPVSHVYRMNQGKTYFTHSGCIHSFTPFTDYLNNLSPDSKEYEDTQGTLNTQQSPCGQSCSQESLCVCSSVHSKCICSHLAWRDGRKGGQCSPPDSHFCSLVSENCDVEFMRRPASDTISFISDKGANPVQACWHSRAPRLILSFTFGDFLHREKKQRNISEIIIHGENWHFFSLSVFSDSFSLCLTQTAAVVVVSDIADQANDSLKHGVSSMCRCT